MTSSWRQNQDFLVKKVDFEWTLKFYCNNFEPFFGTNFRGISHDSYEAYDMVLHMYYIDAASNRQILPLFIPVVDTCQYLQPSSGW